jgi:hypothetical protein
LVSFKWACWSTRNPNLIYDVSVLCILSENRAIGPVFCPSNFNSERYIYREVLTFVDRFTSLRFTTTGAPPAVGRIRILAMKQYV